MMALVGRHVGWTDKENGQRGQDDGQKKSSSHHNIKRVSTQRRQNLNLEIQNGWRSSLMRMVRADYTTDRAGGKESKAAGFY